MDLKLNIDLFNAGDALNYILFFIGNLKNILTWGELFILKKNFPSQLID